MTTGGGWAPAGDGWPDPVVLPRPRLIRRLDQLSTCRFVAVVANPGAGKTTLLRDWADRRRSTWHTLRPADRDPQHLFAAVAAALRGAGVQVPVPNTLDDPAVLAGLLVEALVAAGPAATPPPGPAATPTTDPAAGATVRPVGGSTADPAAAVETASAGSAAGAGPAGSVPAAIRLVLDDAHLLVGGPSAGLLAALATRLPAGTVLVVAGRDPLPFPAGPLRSAGRLGEITAADLALTPAEVRRMLAAAGPAGQHPIVRRSALDCADSPGVVAAIAGLATEFGAGRGHRATRPREVGALAPPGLDELSSTLDEADLAALWTLSAIRRAGPRGRVAGAYDRALRELAGRRRLAAGQFAPLRAARLVLGGPSGIPDADLVLAESAVRDGQHDEALRHLAAVPAGMPLPAALAWQLGTLLHRRGEFDDAEALLERALPGTGTPGGGTSGGGTSGLADQAQVMAGRAAVRWARGDGARTRELADEAVRLAEESRDDAAIAAAYVARALAAFSAGDRAGNEHAYARALAAAVRAGDLAQQLRIHCNVGSRLVEEGRYRAATEELGAAIRLGEQTGQRLLLALALHNRAEAWLGLGELARARTDSDAALSLWQRDGSPLAAFGLLLTARVHRVCGSTSQAVAGYRAALAMAEPDGNAQVLMEACAGLARTRYADDPAAAAEYARRALAMPSANGPTVAELAAGWVALCSGDVASARRHAERARAEAGPRRDPAGLAEAIELAALATGLAGPAGTAGGASGSDAGRTSGRPTVGLVEAAQIWADAGNEVALATNALLRARLGADRPAEEVAYQRLHRLGVREGAWHVAGPLAAIGPAPVPEVEVQTLGHFVVRLAGVPVPAAAWQSRKARELVKVLAGQLGRPLGRETLAAVLWPETPAEVALRRLSVLVSTVRAVLDPGRRHPADRYLDTDPATVGINPDQVSVDAVRFHDAARSAIAADGASPPDGRTRVNGGAPVGERDEAGGVEILGRLEAVVGMYTGDFCDDGEVTGDWVARPRTALAELHRELIRRLARRCLRTGRPEAAVGWYLRLTSEDGYDESAHLGLVTALSAAGRHGEAARRYQDYLDRMREIEVQPTAFPAATAAAAGPLNDS
ncbi:BTAD domain-containing putative transcriptional regulator [Plantactinospora sp. CA-294935]|uniref:BTAD domain-containing putative transcriptional regulator n=1 Tax=Plantactinospora sp. CA-294935 TaxID=3240012 RepID=UPI003D8A81B0